MTTKAAGPAPNEMVLSGQSLWPPSLTGYPYLGVTAAWTGAGGKIYLASDQTSPPYQPAVVNPEWTTSDTPAVAIAMEWKNLYIAWTDLQGAVRLSSTALGWNSDIVVAPAGSTAAGPALVFIGRWLIVAWQNMKGMMELGIVDRHDKVQPPYLTDVPMSSRPTLAWSPGSSGSPGTLYALSGGNPNGQGNLNMRVFWSLDQGGFGFAETRIPSVPTFGPPSMAIADDQFYLVWADASTLGLRFAATKSLQDFSAIAYSDGCHGGGPAILGLPDRVILGWSYGAPPEDPKAHHITLAQETVIITARAPDKEHFAGLAAVPAPDPCPDPSTVYDPSTGECVARGGCIGDCVMQSFTVVFDYLIFNPIKYASCVIACELHS